MELFIPQSPYLTISFLNSNTVTLMNEFMSLLSGSNMVIMNLDKMGKHSCNKRNRYKEGYVH